MQLVHVTDKGPGFRRVGEPGAFQYLTTGGRPLTAKAHLERIHRLAIPPAWTDVWIAPRSNAHLQATGRDAKGRKQYRYHADFRAEREETKYAQLLEFAEGLPRLRGRIARDLAREGLPREKVIAAVVKLLELTLCRIGNECYAEENDSYGLTTLKARHAKVQGDAIRFLFKGKSGKTWRLQLEDRRVTAIIRELQELPGQHLFQYAGEDGAIERIDSRDVNAYLRAVTGRAVTAKYFRTWAGTVLSARALGDAEPPASETAAKRTINQAVRQVAERLGNTPAICRACYIHPFVFESYRDGRLQMAMAAELERPRGLTVDEAAVMALLRAYTPAPVERARAA